MLKNRTAFLSALSVLPKKIRTGLTRVTDEKFSVIYEIRLYTNAPVGLFTDNGLFFITDNGLPVSEVTAGCLYSDKNDIRQTVLTGAGYSLFAHERELNHGYLTYGKGIRMGMTFDTGKERFSLERLSSLTVRVPYSHRAALPDAVKVLFCNRKPSVLFVGAPGSGKTTLMGACLIYLTSVNSPCRYRVSVADERGELGAYITENGDCFAEVFPFLPKAEGIQRALHLMNPEYILSDEIGNRQETLGILEGLNGGVSFLASMHAGSPSELNRREQFRILKRERVFDYFVFLSPLTPGIPQKILTREELCRETDGVNDSEPECGNSGHL